jgi:hypothetical protein
MMETAAASHAQRAHMATSPFPPVGVKPTSFLSDVDKLLARRAHDAGGISGPSRRGLPTGYGVFADSVAYPSPFQLSIGQKEADWYPCSSASFAACELSRPLPHVNTSVRSLGIAFRASWRSANGI